MNNIYELYNQSDTIACIHDINEKLEKEYEKDEPSNEVIQTLMFEQLLKGLNLQLFPFQR